MTTIDTTEARECPRCKEWHDADHDDLALQHRREHIMRVNAGRTTEERSKAMKRALKKRNQLT